MTMNATGYDVLDEDNMASDSDTSLATQQSIKAYVDAAVAGSGGSGFEYVDTKTASASASLAFTDFAADSIYRLTFFNLKPTSDAVDCYVTASNDNGSSYSSTSLYQYNNWVADTNTSLDDPTGESTNGNAQWQMAAVSLLIGNASTEFGINGYLDLYSVNVTGAPIVISGKLTYCYSGQRLTTVAVHAISQNYNGSSLLSAVDALKFAPSTSTWATGSIIRHKFNLS